MLWYPSDARKPKYDSTGSSKTFYQYDKGILDLEKASLPMVKVDSQVVLHCSGFIIKKGDFNYYGTAKHCLDSISDSLLYWPLRVNKDSFEFQNISNFRSANKTRWTMYQDKSIDVAVIPFFEKVSQFELIPIAYNKISKDSSFSELDETFYIPHQTLDGKIFQLFRTGGISYQHDQHQFLIDGYSIPGYSGCPIYLKPSIIRSQAKGTFLGFEDPDGFNLVGIMSGQVLNYQPSRLNKSVIVEHNSGLAVATFAYYIRKLIDVSEESMLRNKKYK